MVKSDQDVTRAQKRTRGLFCPFWRRIQEDWATKGIVPRVSSIVARFKNVEFTFAYWIFCGTMDYLMCHDGLMSLLPRQINEGIVTRWSRNMARWWAFMKP